MQVVSNQFDWIFSYGGQDVAYIIVFALSTSKRPNLHLQSILICIHISILVPCNWIANNMHHASTCLPVFSELVIFWRVERFVCSDRNSFCYKSHCWSSSSHFLLFPSAYVNVLQQTFRSANTYSNAPTCKTHKRWNAIFTLYSFPLRHFSSQVAPLGSSSSAPTAHQTRTKTLVSAMFAFELIHTWGWAQIFAWLTGPRRQLNQGWRQNWNSLVCDVGCRNWRTTSANGAFFNMPY